MMRKRSTIMPSPCEGDLSKAGRYLQSVELGIVVELMLDLRQIAAASFIISNGGTLPTPLWLKDIAGGK